MNDAREAAVLLPDALRQSVHLLCIRHIALDILQ